MSKKLALKRAFRKVALDCARRNLRGGRANLTKDHDWNYGCYNFGNLTVIVTWDDEGEYIDINTILPLEMSETNMAAIVDYARIWQAACQCDEDDPIVTAVLALVNGAMADEAGALADELLALMEAQ